MRVFLIYNLSIWVQQSRNPPRRERIWTHEASQQSSSPPFPVMVIKFILKIWNLFSSPHHHHRVTTNVFSFGGMQNESFLRRSPRTLILKRATSDGVYPALFLIYCAVLFRIWTWTWIGGWLATPVMMWREGIAPSVQCAYCALCLFIKY